MQYPPCKQRCFLQCDLTKSLPLLKPLHVSLRIKVKHFNVDLWPLLTFLAWPLPSTLSLCTHTSQFINHSHSFQQISSSTSFHRLWREGTFTSKTNTIPSNFQKRKRAQRSYMFYPQLQANKGEILLSIFEEEWWKRKFGLECSLLWTLFVPVYDALVGSGLPNCPIYSYPAYLLKSHPLLQRWGDEASERLNNLCKIHIWSI